MDLEIIDIDAPVPPPVQAQTQAEPAAADPAGGAPASAPAPAPVPQIDPAVLAAEIARQVAVQTRQYQPQPQYQQPQQMRSPTEQTAEQLIRQGIPEAAVRAMFAASAAQTEQLLRATQQQAAQEKQQKVYGEYWDQAENAFEHYAARIPGLGPLKASVVDLYHQKLHSDPQYKAEVLKLGQGRLPNSTLASKAMAETIDELLKTTGIARPAGTVNLSSSRPSAPAGTASDGDPISRLDQNQKKQYLAFRSKGDAFDPVAYKNALDS